MSCSVTAEEVCILLALFDVCVYCTEVKSEMIFLMNPASSSACFWFLWQDWTICRFLHLPTAPSGHMKNHKNCSKSILSLDTRIQNSRPSTYPNKTWTNELLTLYKGHLFLKWYHALKLWQFRIKTFELCKSNFWLSVVLNSLYWKRVFESPLISKDTENNSIISEILWTHSPKRYTVWMDNYCNSLALAKFLKLCNTDGLRSSQKTGAEENWRQQNAGGWGHCGPMCIVRWSSEKLVTVIYVTILLQSRQQERGEKRNGILHACYIIINTLVMLLSRNLPSGEENNAYNSSEAYSVPVISCLVTYRKI
jgi:hypothetical protein